MRKTKHVREYASLRQNDFQRKRFLLVVFRRFLLCFFDFVFVSRMCYFCCFVSEAEIPCRSLTTKTRVISRME